jgi:uncharacterized repeat protein (TIGR01451 family)
MNTNTHHNMKKLILLLLLFTGIVKAQIVNIPDANFKNRLVNTLCVDTNSDNISDSDVDTNNDGEIQISEALVVTRLNVSGNIDNVLIPPPLQVSNISGIESFSNLQLLDCSFNQISILDLNSFTNLLELYCDNNLLNTLDIIPIQNAIKLSCKGNFMTTIDVSSNSNLIVLACGGVNFNALNVSNLTNLRYLEIIKSSQTSLNLSNIEVNVLYLSETNIISLEIPLTYDVPTSQSTLVLTNNLNLVNLNIKNGKFQNLTLNNCPNLLYVCEDESYIDYVLNILNLSLGINPNAQVSSYCSFTPGGNYNTLSGNIKLDTNNNGCDVFDLPQPNIRVNINDGLATGASFTNTTGNYSFFTQAGSFALNPTIENPSWFTFSPTTATVPFADNNNNTATQDFCISANGVHPDLEVVLIPITPARPGFDAVYQIIFKNKGNQTLNGVLSFNYDVFRLLFISSNTTPDFNFEGTINWNFTNLLPFESRLVSLTLNVNSPVETPAVNIGDILNFTTSITPVTGDELPLDNTFIYNQTVVGSFDPNEIICLEGTSVAPSEIGKYLHYAINFENTGNFPAENVVVKTIIDPAKFDINSLQLLNTSSPVDARITGNVVEFIFKNVQLAGPGGHGHVLLKVKSKNTLVAGDNVSKNANIYFDYNAPVDTGLVTTVFQSLSNSVFVKDDSVSVSPNPASGNITINCNSAIKTIEVYDVQGRVLQTVLSTNNLDISDKTNGVYFLKITTEKGSKVEKIIKE